MGNAFSVEPTDEETAKVELELHSLFAAMDRIDERIAKNQQETDRLKAKTKTKLAQLRTLTNYTTTHADAPV